MAGNNRITIHCFIPVPKREKQTILYSMKHSRCTLHGPFSGPKYAYPGLRIHGVDYQKWESVVLGGGSVQVDDDAGQIVYIIYVHMGVEFARGTMTWFTGNP